MKLNVFGFMFLLSFCFTPLIFGQFPQEYKALITHKASAHFLERLYNFGYIDSVDVRPCIDQGITAWKNAHDTGDSDGKAKALALMKIELIKALSAAKHFPPWITFHELEHLHMEHHAYGFSKHEIKKFSKLAGAALAGALVMYVLKNRSEAIFYRHVDAVFEKLDARGRRLDAKIDAKIDRIEAKLDAKGVEIQENLPVFFKKVIKESLDEVDTKLEKWRQELKDDLGDARTVAKDDLDDVKTQMTEWIDCENYQDFVYKTSAGIASGGTTGGAAYGTTKAGKWLKSWFVRNPQSLVTPDLD